MSPAAEQAGELSPSEKLFAERRMDVELYQAHSDVKEARRLICSFSKNAKDAILLQLLNVAHDDNLSGAVVDMQSDILTLIAEEKSWEIAEVNYAAHMANIKRSQQRKDDLL